MVLKDIKNEIVPLIKNLPKYGKLSISLYKDYRVNRLQKFMLMVSFGYTISPVDLIPGFIPVVGQLDDLYVMLSLLNRVLKSLPSNIAKEHLEEVGLNVANIEEDLKSVKKTTGKIAVGSVKFFGKSIWFITKAIFKIGKWVTIKKQT